MTLNPDLSPEDQDVAEQERREAESRAEEEWNELAQEQGWSPLRQLGVAEGFIREKGMFVEFAEFAQKVSDDEVEELESLARNTMNTAAPAAFEENRSMASRLDNMSVHQAEGITTLVF